MISLEVLVEEPSAARVLDVLLPRIVPGVPFEIREFHGKDMLLKALPKRLAGYAVRLRWERLKIVVLVDRDDDDCVELKARLDATATGAGLVTRAAGSEDVQLMNRVVVEELEAWFFGDITALVAAFPRVSRALGMQAKYRDPDAIRNTWETLERVLTQQGYHKSGLRKLEAAREIAEHMDVENNRSKSFQVFRDGLRRLVSEGTYAEED